MDRKSVNVNIEYRDIADIAKLPTKCIIKTIDQGEMYRAGILPSGTYNYHYIN